MRFLAPWICAVAMLTPTTASSANAPAFPKTIQGIWMNDDEEGRAQCQHYMAASKQDSVDASVYLVGAEIIRGDIWHSYAEYGEGNSYEILSLEKLGGQRWRFAAKAYIDGAPDSDDSQPVVASVKLERQILTWALETIGGKAVDSWDEHRYFRCATIARGLYGS